MSAITAPPFAAGPPAVEEYRPFPNETGRNWRQEHVEIPLLVRALGLDRGLSVLEVGCGRGVALPVLARLLRPARLVGVDIDAALLEDARGRAAAHGIAAEIVEADVRLLPFPDAAFDLCIDFGTLFHIARAERALEQLARVIQPGGLLVTETPLSQFLSHPIRSRGRGVPWAACSRLRPARHALLWRSYRVTP